MITGGFGYIGGRLSKYLYDHGHEVIVASRERRTDYGYLPNVETRTIDWDDQKNLGGLCKGIDVVFHAAGMNAAVCASNPAGALKFNGLASTCLVDSAIENKVSNFIYFSTAHVYSSPLVGHISEESCETNVHPYATSHLAAEKHLLYRASQGSIKGYVFRLSNTYGPPVDSRANCWMLLMNDICKQAVTENTIVLNSSGMQRRDFIPMSSLCYISEYFARSEYIGANRPIINVGGGWAPRVIEVAELVRDRCGEIYGHVPEIHRPADGKTDNDSALIFDISKLRKYCSLPVVDVKSEIDATLKFCKNAFC